MNYEQKNTVIEVFGHITFNFTRGVTVYHRHSGFRRDFFCISPAYVKQNKEGKLRTVTFARLVGIVLKVISKISVQKFTHRGYSYLLLVPVYFG